MKNSQYKIDELNILAHHAETTNTNIEFTAQQIKDIIRIMLNLRGQIIDLEALQTKPLSDEEILHIYNESYRNTLMGIDPLVFAREIEERHGIK